MLPKEERIKYNGLFQQAHEKGKKLNAKNLRLSFTQTRPAYKDSMPFFGISISKNFDKRAVVRNKVRRRLADIYRKLRNENFKKLGLIVLSPRGPYISKKDAFEYNNLKNELESLIDPMLKA